MQFFVCFIDSENHDKSLETTTATVAAVAAAAEAAT